MQIDEKTVRRIGHLARLEIKEDQVDPYKNALTQILNWVEQLGEVKTDQVEPMFSVFLDQMPQRQDQVNDGDQVRDILANAPDKDLNMFAVPKVVE
jgi:aspartyl/glutamyl-tRNA(Asn/Gln) amidotransferase subunit C (EC 6.3.5.-)